MKLLHYKLLSLSNNPYFLQTAASVSVATISTILTVIMARRLGVEGFGQYTMYMTVAAIFYVIQGGGYKTVLFKDIATPSQMADRTENLVGYAFGHLILVSLIIIGGCALYFKHNFLGYVLAVLAFGGQAAAGLISSEMRAHGQFKSDAWWQLCVRLTGAAFIIAVLLLDYKESCIVIGALAAGQIIILWFSPVRFRIPIFHIPFHNTWGRTGLALMVIEIATLVYHRIDVVILGWYLGAQAIGNYAAAYKFIDATILLLTPAGVVFFRLARKSFFLTPPKAAKTIIQFSALFIILGVIFFGLIIISAKTITILVFGTNYIESGELLSMLSFSLLFMIPNIIFSQAVISMNQEHVYAVCSCLAAVLNISCNFLLIPILGAEGACISTGITELFLMACFLWMILHKLRSLRQDSISHNPKIS
ncbi:MAG: polysaccharide biosynthesis C-terminal domain-containing protein [Planctomycetaceae bacterium]|nr:polysaccharide biosynthesis C-terminal domain-containing protein [Planctomycetaceae bacterium]